MLGEKLEERWGDIRGDVMLEERLCEKLEERWGDIRGDVMLEERLCEKLEERRSLLEEVENNWAQVIQVLEHFQLGV